MSTAPAGVEDSPYAWMRLGLALVLGTIGGVGMWSAVVVLPAIEREFGLDRADASLPFTMVTIGFAIGGVVMGKLADRFGVAVPVAIGGASLGVGYVIAGMAPNLWVFTAAHAVPIGLLGSSAVFGPLMADSSRWFLRNRGIAVAVSAAGNYLAAAIWPPVVQAMIELDRVAVGACRGGHRVRGGAGADVAAGAPAAARACAGGGGAARGPLAAWDFASAVDGVAVRGRGDVLRGDVDAAGAHRRLLRRPGLRGGARGGDAVADVRLRGDQPAWRSGWIADRIGGLWTLLLGSTLQAMRAGACISWPMG